MNVPIVAQGMELAKLLYDPLLATTVLLDTRMMRSALLYMRRWPMSELVASIEGGISMMVCREVALLFVPMGMIIDLARLSCSPVYFTVPRTREVGSLALLVC